MTSSFRQPPEERTCISGVAALLLRPACRRQGPLHWSQTVERDRLRMAKQFITLPWTFKGSQSRLLSLSLSISLSLLLLSRSSLFAGRVPSSSLSFSALAASLSHIVASLVSLFCPLIFRAGFSSLSLLSLLSDGCLSGCYLSVLVSFWVRASFFSLSLSFCPVSSSSSGLLLLSSLFSSLSLSVSSLVSSQLFVLSFSLSRARLVFTLVQSSSHLSPTQSSPPYHTRYLVRPPTASSSSSPLARKVFPTLSSLDCPSPCIFPLFLLSSLRTPALLSLFPGALKCYLLRSSPPLSNPHLPLSSSLSVPLTLALSSLLPPSHLCLPALSPKSRLPALLIPLVRSPPPLYALPLSLSRLLYSHRLSPFFFSLSYLLSLFTNRFLKSALSPLSLFAPVM
ncbi:hypothetical protein C7M84_018189 [Penaeus vannamei]|uniref:Uncharacterized protein n=1 Tax=Penaeus vannamei TaxID=6689 RepID=A0A423SI26_PENVA|nr:hypothetical protein C7M84_018189 [Penaeus vannamei]